MKEMMKEVVVIEPHKVEVREVPVPEPANEDEVLIQMKSAGVCGSDHHIYHGLNPCSTYPRIPGHENAGIVVRAGANVTNVKVGDHVIVDLISTCGTCYQCTHGRKNVCEHVKVRGSGADGGWREYFTAPAKEVYKISDSVSWEDAVMGEEIFGPVLPVLSYRSLEEAVRKIRSMPCPLALYLFSASRRNISYVKERVSFGGGCINDTLIHLATSAMGFGGVGESGMGAYHGRAGFEAFSHDKSIVDKKTWMDLPMRYQPYQKKLYGRLLHLFLR